MNNSQADLSFAFDTLAVMPSLRCDANCRHCLFEKETRKKSRFDPALFANLIKSIPRQIIHISITGGEPFFDLDDLFSVTSKIAKRSIEFSIVTNGLWTRRTDEVENIIAKLCAQGLSGLAVSFDEYHQPRLSESELNDFLLLVASKKVRISVKSCGNEMRLFVRRIKRRFSTRRIPLEVEWFSLDRVGTASKQKSDIVRKKICSSCALLGRPLVVPDGTVFACCSTEILDFENDWLIRGNAKNRTTADIISESERDFRLIAAAALGPAGFAKLLGIKPKKDETSCELCVRILNNKEYREELEEKLKKDKRLRQEVVGRFFLLSHKLYEKEKQQRERWREYFRRIGAEK